MVDRKCDYLLHYNIHKRQKIENLMNLKSNVVMEHLQIYGVL